MKKIIILMLVFVVIFACKKNNTTDTNSTEPTVSSDKETSKAQYVKYQSWFYKNESDLNKAVKDVKEKTLLEFGNKVTVLSEKKDGDKTYVQIQIPDKSIYWGTSDRLCERFITITQPNTVCYTQPQEDYPQKNFKLQPGDFAYFIEEQDGFIKVDFISYLPRKKDNGVTWVGTVWIKDGYTDDVKTAKESYLLALAYNKLYGKAQVKNSAIELIKQALEVNNGEKTEITDVILTIYTELTGKNYNSSDASSD